MSEQLPKKWCGDDHGHWDHTWVDGIYNKQCPGYEEVVPVQRPVTRKRKKRAKK
ncbi:hypothetical protein GCM10010423_64930 [Streptomyces levis]|uniref:Uncharacterized protein n=1 Tax=Streptomyces levis TaxID=285566 RepID=A0ABN3P2H4_9ACTN